MSWRFILLPCLYNVYMQEIYGFSFKWIWMWLCHFTTLAVSHIHIHHHAHHRSCHEPFSRNIFFFILGSNQTVQSTSTLYNCRWANSIFQGRKKRRVCHPTRQGSRNLTVVSHCPRRGHQHNELGAFSPGIDLLTVHITQWYSLWEITEHYLSINNLTQGIIEQGLDSYTQIVSWS